MKPWMTGCVLAGILLASIAGTGCIAERSTGPAVDQEPTWTPAETVVSGSRPVVITDPGLEGIEVEVSAREIPRTGNLLIDYTLFIEGIPMKSEGYGIMLTAFAYNPGSVPEGFSPASYDDVIGANIPYQSVHLRLYPSTRYHDDVEPRQAPAEGRTLDISQPYTYGVVIRLVD
jgi:hypothetical protein